MFCGKNSSGESASRQLFGCNFLRRGLLFLLYPKGFDPVGFVFQDFSINRRLPLSRGRIQKFLRVGRTAFQLAGAGFPHGLSEQQFYVVRWADSVFLYPFGELIRKADGYIHACTLTAWTPNLIHIGGGIMQRFPEAEKQIRTFPTWVDGPNFISKGNPSSG